MFSPEMLEQAQRMMAEMSPEQMAEMAKLASTMNPNMFPKGTPKVDAEQFKKAQEKMKGMSPDEVKDALKQGKAAMAAGQTGAISATVTRLKEDGNALFKAAAYNDAILKYDEALLELDKDEITEASEEFRMSVLANIAFCYMKLKEWAQCISFASQVLAVDPTNIKALFRRGVAYRHTGKISLALRDLREASRIAPSDAPITAELLEVEAMDPGQDETQVPPAVTRPSIPDPKKAVQMMRANPDMIDGVTDMMANMSEEQLEGMMAASGLLKGGEAKVMKDLMKNKDMMKSVTEMMKNIDPEQLEAMTRTMGSSSSSSEQPQMPSDPSRIFSDPKMMQSMETMIDKMPDEVIDELLKKSAGENAQIPSVVTGSRLRMVIKLFMKVVRLWLYIKAALTSMMTKQGAIILAVVILVISILLQFL